MSTISCPFSCRDGASAYRYVAGPKPPEHRLHVIRIVRTGTDRIRLWGYLNLLPVRFLVRFTLLSLLPLLRPLQLWIERVRRHSHFSIKGTLPYPKPTPSENPRRKLKKLKNSKPPMSSLSRCRVPRRGKKKKLRIRAAQIPAETATRSFRKMDYSFKDTPGFIISPTQRVS